MCRAALGLSEGQEAATATRPSQFVNMDWREDYLGKGGAPDRALAVSIWDSPNDAQRILMSGTALRSVAFVHVTFSFRTHEVQK